MDCLSVEGESSDGLTPLPVGKKNTTSSLVFCFHIGIQQEGHTDHMCKENVLFIYIQLRSLALAALFTKLLLQFAATILRHNKN